MRQKRFRAIIVSAVLVGAVAAGGWTLWSALRVDAAESPAATYTVRRGSLVEIAAANGTIEPHVQVELKSRVAGEVMEVLVSEGDDVESGTVLVRLDPDEAQRAIQQAETALRRARADLAQAQASLTVSRAEARNAEADDATRARGAELGLVSSQDRRSAATALETAGANVRLREAQLTSSRAQVASAELALGEAQRHLADTEIRAPIGGTVLAIEVERGAIVSSGITSNTGGTVLMTIANLADLRVVGQIDEAQVGRVAAGQDVEVRVDAYPERVFTGRVERVARLGRQDSNIVTFDVEIVVTDPDAHMLRSGMSADVEIVTARNDDVLLVPLTAIRTAGSRHVVTMADGQQRRVRTGATDGARIAVLEGLEEGETLLLGVAVAPAGAARPEGAAGDRTKQLFGGRGGRRGGGIR